MPLAPSNFRYRTPGGRIQGFVSRSLTMETILGGPLSVRWTLLEIDGM